MKAEDGRMRERGDETEEGDVNRVGICGNDCH